ncbi:uncharacterized protein VTP21DRAFT_4773 [Calcarisporiella thermophila]|uniref:uncharacterized protein n=1 Tax=Calcarisporiella thermophila TaxID=911321 RepID=UPI003743DDCC
MIQSLNSGLTCFWQFIPIVNKTEWAKKSFSGNRDRLYSFVNKAIEKSLATYSKIADKNKLPLVCILAEFPQYLGEEGRITLMHDMLILIYGGSETTTNVLSFAFGEIARRTEVQKKIFAEVQDIFGNVFKVNPREFLPEHLNRLNYSTAVMRESYRVYPPGVVSYATAKEDYQVCGFLIPAGTDIMCNILGILKDPELFPNPDKFDPERWTTSTVNSNANAPAEENVMVNQGVPEAAFTLGAHACMGRHLATLELRCLIALLVNAFHLELKEGSEINTKVFFSMKPKDGVWIKFKKRCHNP